MISVKQNTLFLKQLNLTYCKFVSKHLQQVSLLTPKVMSVYRKVMRSFDKLLILLDRDGGDAFQRDDILLTASEILEKLTDEEEEIIPKCHL